MSVVEKCSLLKLEYDSKKTVCVTNTNLQTCLNELELNNTKETNQKKIIRDIVHIYVDSKGNNALHIEVKNLIIELFTRFNNKRQLKKCLEKLVLELNLVNNIIKATVDELIGQITSYKTCDLKLCNEFLHFVSLMQTFPVFDFKTNFSYLFPLYVNLIEGFTEHANKNFDAISPVLDDVNTLMNAVFKQILPVFIKGTNFSEELKTKYTQDLLKLCFILLSNERLSFDLRTKIGLVFIYSFDVSDLELKICDENCPVLELSESLEENKYFSLLDTIEKCNKANEFNIVLYSSIVNVVAEEKLFSEKRHDKYLACNVYEKILEIAKRESANSAVIVETSRTINMLGKNLSKIPADCIKPIFVESLSYVFSHIEHFIHTVRNYAKLFYKDLIYLAAQHYENGNEELTDSLLEKIKSVSNTSSINFFTYEFISKFMGSDFLYQKFPSLPGTLLQLVEDVSVSEQVCKTYINVMEEVFPTEHEDQEQLENSRDDWAKIWVFPVLNLLKKNKNAQVFCQKVVSNAFCLQPFTLRKMFPKDYIGSTAESAVLLNSLHFARKNGIEVATEKQNNVWWRGLIDKSKMELFMVHQDENIRMLVLASVVDSLKTTELYLDWEFIFLINFIRYNIAAESPNIRKQIITYYTRALQRYERGLQVILRNLAHTNEEEINKDRQKLVYHELKKSYRRFIVNFTKILIGNLSSGSNYPRRAVSLELLLVIHGILPAEEWKTCWTEDDVKNSHNILFDTYESNKRMIVALLKTIPPHYLGFTNVEFTSKYIQRSFDLALSVKPNKTISAAYLFEVCTFSPYIQECFDPKKNWINYDPTLGMIIILIKNFMVTSEENPLEPTLVSKGFVYGLIFSIRHLLEKPDLRVQSDICTGLFTHLVTMCFSIKDKVLPVVCNQAPEGYVPDSEDDDYDIGNASKAQLIMVYAWRTMKEITLLLAEIVRRSLKSETQLLPDDQLIMISELFVVIFIESRHRGVFEQAFVGFSTICKSFWTTPNPTINRLPKMWLDDALDMCTGAKNSNPLCATRRSAGLPFFILSILTTDPSYDKTHFQHAMNVLLDGAKKSDAENQIHCLNVLRAVFRHSKLGEAVAPYVAQGVILAIEGLRSEIWGIRNSATLLYTALITRIFGVQRTQDSEDLCMKNRLRLNVFSMRYPELFQFLLETLSIECKNNDSTVLHPVLMILARLYPSYIEEHNSKADEYLPYVNVCLANPSFRTREISARASVPFINKNQVKSFLEESFLKISNVRIEDNLCHGILLQVWHILKNNVVTSLPVEKFVRDSLQVLKLVGKRFSHMTCNLYVEIIIYLLKTFSDFKDFELLKEIVLILSEQIHENIASFTWRNKFITNQIILTYFIIINKFEETPLTYTTIRNQILSFLYSDNQHLKRFSLYFLISLNNTFEKSSDKNYKEHPLLFTGDVEIPDDVENLVETFDYTSIEKLLRNFHPYIINFISDEFKDQNNSTQDDRILVFLLAKFYPCAIRCLKLSKQETLNALVSLCGTDCEEIVTAVICCISGFLMDLDYGLMQYGELTGELVISSRATAALHSRLAICELLCKNYILYCNEEPVGNGRQVCLILSMILVLLEDDELEVRNSMARYQHALKIRIKIDSVFEQALYVRDTSFSSLFDLKQNYSQSTHTCPVVPEKAKEDLIYLAAALLPQQIAISFIFSWACRYFHNSCEPFEIFERGNVNLYAENTPSIDVCSRVLIKILWTLPDGLNYEDRSVFLEEQTLVVATTLLDSLEKHVFPLMLLKSRQSVICALKSIINFVERVEISENFANEFKTYLYDTTMKYLTQHLEQCDLFSVKKVIRKLFDPVFRNRR